MEQATPGSHERGRCLGLRTFAPGCGEIRRLYLKPDLRGRGVVRAPAERVIREARCVGYARPALDTLPVMKAVRALCGSPGFSAIPPYPFNPVEGTACLGLRL